MKLDRYDSIYFLGIGGIGMSALARWFIKSGLNVSGYDRTRTELTMQLEKEGMEIHYEDNIDLIPEGVKANKETCLIVFTPAVPSTQGELNYFKANQFTILKRSEVLGLITKGYKTVAVAGTHGKTTTSSMIAHILKQAGMNMVAFLGGVTANYASNLVMQGEIGSDTIVVVEADEYDRSFLRLFPDVAVVTSADADHLDIYGDHNAILESFKDFIKQIDKSGALIIHESIEEKLTEGLTIEKCIYGMSRGQFFTSSITVKGGFFDFDLCGFATVEKIRLGVPGFHNVENAIAASVAAHLCGVNMESIKESLATFKGVKRRFEFILRTEKTVFIDDYAHHPKEIEAFLKSLKSLYPNRKITAVFQPHLFSRTRDFADEFSSSLSLADEVVLLGIYPAREEPIPGVDSNMILNAVTSPVKLLCGKPDLINKLSELDIDVIATIGAGDIDTFIEPIKQMLMEKYERV